VIVATTEQLAELVRGAIDTALAEHSQGNAPALLDRNGVARALGVSTSMVDRLRKAGLPCIWLGDSPRFLVDECVSWLVEHRRVQHAESEA
jgi:hypothetical protein